MVASLRTLGNRWHWDYRRVQRFMNGLKTRTAIETVRETPDGTVYAIVNYDTYSVAGIPDETPNETAMDTAARQQRDKNNNNRTKEEEYRGEVAEVFGHWVDKRKEVLQNTRRPTLTAKRRKKIVARLREGWTVDELKRAIDGCLASEFHVEGGWTDLELILRNDGKVEQFIHRAPAVTKQEDFGRVILA